MENWPTVLCWFNRADGTRAAYPVDLEFPNRVVVEPAKLFPVHWTVGKTMFKRTENFEGLISYREVTS